MNKYTFLLSKRCERSNIKVNEIQVKMQLLIKNFSQEIELE